jgi:hypothetical protein
MRIVRILLLLTLATLPAKAATIDVSGAFGTLGALGVSGIRAACLARNSRVLFITFAGAAHLEPPSTVGALIRSYQGHLYSGTGPSDSNG